MGIIRYKKGIIRYKQGIKGYKKGIIYGFYTLFGPEICLHKKVFVLFLFIVR